MSVAEEGLAELQNQIRAGFKVLTHSETEGVHYFSLPALEYDGYTLGVPDSLELRQYMSSCEYTDAQMVPVKLGVALLDLIGFSANPDDVQLKLIVRYQNEIRKATTRFSVTRMISIGDGTIFIFEGDDVIADMPGFLIAVDHAIAGCNLDWRADGPEIGHRIGVHVGSGYSFKDINGDPNYVGTAINLAQRVSTCVPDPQDTPLEFGLDSPIYVSAEAKEELARFSSKITFYDAGKKDVKHGVEVHVFAMSYQRQR